MFEHIHGTGKAITCGRLMLTARACCEWTDLDQDEPAIGADDIRVSVHNAESGEFIAEFCFIRASYDRYGFDSDDGCSELLDDNGTPLDDVETFGLRALPRVYAAHRAALKSLWSVIEPTCAEFLKEVENEM